MFQHNFWAHILIGMRDLLHALASQAPVHAPLGLSALVANIWIYGGAILLFLIGSFFHLSVFGITAGITVALEVVRAAIAVYRWAIGFLPLP